MAHLTKRGALLVFEGCDRCGKSTQARLLVDKLISIGFRARLMHFPDRETSTGKEISAYLCNKIIVDDHRIHSLFAENRREVMPKMKADLLDGITLVVDRYAYSGAAYSSAKVSILPLSFAQRSTAYYFSSLDFYRFDPAQTWNGLDLEWCKSADKGLLRPDAVFFLEADANAVQTRDGFGGERYEKIDFQRKVAAQYQKLQDQDPSWKTYNALQDKQDLHDLITADAIEVVKRCGLLPLNSDLWT